MKKLLYRMIGLRINLMALLQSRNVGRVGARYLGDPGPRLVNQKHLNFFTTAAQRDINFEGSRIRTYQWGKGANSILFLHGWQSHTYRWKRYIESFDQNRYTIYALDGLAHGQSEGKAFNIALYGQLLGAFFQQSGPVDFVVAHSMGCFAFLYAAHHKLITLPRGAVLLAAPGEAVDYFESFGRVTGLSTRSTLLLESHFERTFGIAIRDFSARKFAKGLTVDGLLIHDIHDEDTDVRYSRDIHSVWTNSQLVETNGLGHNLRSEDVVRLVHDFIDKRDKTIGN